MHPIKKLFAPALRNLSTSDVDKNNAKYTYRPLNTEMKEVRLLRVEHSTKREKLEISCSLATYPLEKAPSYIAVSYCWGDENDKAPILLDKQRFWVTRTLFSALGQRQLRSNFRGGCLVWVDAICTYPDRHRTKCCRNLRCEPQFCEGVWFCAFSVPIWAWRPPSPPERLYRPLSPG